MFWIDTAQCSRGPPLRLPFPSNPLLRNRHPSPFAPLPSKHAIPTSSISHGNFLMPFALMTRLRIQSKSCIDPQISKVQHLFHPKNEGISEPNPSPRGDHQPFRRKRPARARGPGKYRSTRNRRSSTSDRRSTRRESCESWSPAASEAWPVVTGNTPPSPCRAGARQDSPGTKARTPPAFRPCRLPASFSGSLSNLRRSAQRRGARPNPRLAPPAPPRCPETFRCLAGRPPEAAADRMHRRAGKPAFPPVLAGEVHGSRPGPDAGEALTGRHRQEDAGGSGSKCAGAGFSIDSLRHGTFQREVQ